LTGGLTGGLAGGKLLLVYWAKRFQKA
jgi:hypothetical protein